MIDFSKKTYANILAEQLSHVPDTLDRREGSIIQTALGPASWYIEGIYLDLETVWKNVYADTAGGEYLDMIGGLLGITRKPASYAAKKGIFNVKVPIGSRFSALTGSGYLTYRATEYLGEEDDGYTYKMQCEEAGEIGNGYTGQVIAVDYVTGLTSAQLTTLLISGTVEEEDEILRERFLIKARKPSTSGNKYDYYNWAMECPGVGAAKIFPLADGPGTVKVVIADENRSAASPSLIDKVKDHIEELRPIGADITVVSAVEKAINIFARIKMENGLNLGDVQMLFHDALTEFLKTNAFDVSYISLARIGNILLGVAGIEDFTRLSLNGIEENVKLNDEEIAVPGTIVLEVMQ